MATLKHFVICTFIIFPFQSYAQYYKVLMKTSYYGSSFSNAEDPAFINYNKYAIENNGIPFIVERSPADTLFRLYLYDGETFTCKYKIQAKYSYNNDKLLIDNFIGFFDVDGDNMREAVTATRIRLHTDDDVKGFAFINLITNQCEYFFEGVTSGGFAFLDINNDSYPELITYSSILGHSKTPQPVQPPILPKSPIPSVSSLSPNPFRTFSKIDYYVPIAAAVKLRVFDASGRLCKTLVNANKPAGNYTATWGGEIDGGGRLSPGQYYYTIQIGDFVSNKKVVVLDR